MKTIVDLTEELKEYSLEKDTAAKQAVEANIAPVEADASSASRAYVVGEQLFLNDVLYDVTSPISVGDAIAVGTNITAANKLSADIKSKQDQIEVTTMPTASASNVGKVLIYIGATTSTYTSGQSYQSTLEGGNYIWKPTSISSVDASDVVYDNQTSGLTATDSQAAIDELASQNQTLTSAFVNNVNQNGCKNRFIFDIEEIIQNNTGGTWSGNKFTKGGATFTIDGDSVIFGGTPTGYVNFIFYQKISKSAIYILSGLKDCTNVLFGGCTLYLNGSQVGSIVINSKNDTTLDLSAYTFDTIAIDVKRAGDNVAMSGAAFIMLCLKSDYDLDSTYAPPSKTNQQLTKDSVTWDNLSEVGAVNLLPNNATTQTISGITFTVNDNRSITFSGTASSNAYLTISTFMLSAGTYKLNGANGGVQYKVDIQLIAGGNILASDYSDGATFTLASDTAITARIRVESGYAISGSLTFYPMITPVSYNGPYVPYAKTNRELTEIVTTPFKIAKTDCYCANDTAVHNYTPTAITGYKPIGIVGLSAIADFAAVTDLYEYRLFPSEDSSSIRLGWKTALATTKGVRLMILYVSETSGLSYVSW